MPSLLPSFPSDRPQPGTSLLPVLQQAARSSAGIKFVVDCDSATAPGLLRVSYAELYERAKKDALTLQQLCQSLPPAKGQRIVVLCFAKHSDNVRWFWAVTVAGLVPCISPPFVSNQAQRVRNIAHLDQLLEAPVFLTTKASKLLFADNSNVLVHDVESLPESRVPFRATGVRRQQKLAALMLTSGSTGNSKAVCLTAEQMLAACAGKREHGDKSRRDVFLNWIGLDHVANLVEMHLQAMCVHAEQIHVQANDLLSSPALFLNLIHQQRVTVTFAPNFYLDLLHRYIIAADPTLQNPYHLDLSSLRVLYSGGEANVLNTAVRITQAFEAYGTRGEFLSPGYGLTESCAGITWALNCPSYDVAFEREFTTCGYPLTGACIRVVDSVGREVSPGETGELQLDGPMLFKRYYNDERATAEAFTDDGWFKTGDLAHLDILGQLYITGRIKDTININGVTYACAEIENAVEQARVPGVEPSFIVAFPHRPKNARTEEYCVVYKPTDPDPDGQVRAEANRAISRLANAITSLKPYRVVPLPAQYFDKASLGKLSRSRFRTWFETGEFFKAVTLNQSLIHAYRIENRQAPSSKTEKVVLEVICEMLNLDQDEMSVTSNIFSLGISSLDSFALTQRLQARFGSTKSVSLVDILREPTTRGISSIIDDRRDPNETYDPVVCLQPKGDKTPLWIVHPASGNVLAFIPLAQYLIDRPLYGLRASGVQPGERFFMTVPEMATTYFDAIKRTQPHGPYAIAGYSLGSSVAFEVSKLLTANGDDVRFTGALDSPPHITPLVGNLTWSACLVMVSFFLDLIPERYSNEVIPLLWNEPGHVALDFVIAHTDKRRLHALQLDRTSLAHIADVADSFSRGVQGYEPVGKVPNIDVFVVDPLLSVVPEGGRSVWMDRYLQHWDQFVTQPDTDGNLQYHQCEGSHADMLNTEHVRSFQRILQRVLASRGV